MISYICMTCGVQYAENDSPPEHCPICEDSRQYVNWEEQQWTTLEYSRTKHSNVVKLIEPNLTGIGTEPSLAIGQRVLRSANADGKCFMGLH